LSVLLRICSSSVAAVAPRTCTPWLLLRALACPGCRAQEREGAGRPGRPGRPERARRFRLTWQTAGPWAELAPGRDAAPSPHRRRL